MMHLEGKGGSPHLLPCLGHGLLVSAGPVSFQGFSGVCLPSSHEVTGIMDAYATESSFHVGSWDPNSGHQACRASA